MVVLFVCIDCGKTFSEPARWTEDRGEYFGFPTCEEFVGCPYCYGAYAVAHQCDCCDEWISDDYIKTEDGRRYCNDCIMHMKLGEED